MLRKTRRQQWRMTGSFMLIIPVLVLMQAWFNVARQAAPARAGTRIVARLPIDGGRHD